MKTLCNCVYVCVFVEKYWLVCVLSPSGYCSLLTVTSRLKVTAVLPLACSDVGHLWPPSDLCWPQSAVCLTDDLRPDHMTPLPLLRNVTLCVHNNLQTIAFYGRQHVALFCITFKITFRQKQNWYRNNECGENTASHASMWIFNPMVKLQTMHNIHLECSIPAKINAFTAQRINPIV